MATQKPYSGETSLLNEKKKKKKGPALQFRGAHLESVTGYAEYIALEYVAQLAWAVS